jgi:taurine transport system permease protein
VRQVSPERVLAARSLGASSRQIFFHVVLPSALGEIFIGARLSIGIVYATLIAAEMIAGASGIGWLILDAGRFLRSDYVIAGILIIAAMGIALDRGLLFAQRRIVHWAGK